VIADGGTVVFRNVIDVAEQLVDGQLPERRIQLRQDRVEPIDVALVDAAVVDLQGRGIHVRLEGVVGVREVSQNVLGHIDPPFLPI
jgi:hypothetical protein